MLSLRLVIDTNVLVSAAIKPAGLQRTVFLIAISKPARLYVAHPILEEYSEVLARPELRIRKHFPRFWKKTKVVTPREFVSLAAPHLIK